MQLSELVLLGQKAIGDGEGHAEDEDDQDKVTQHHVTQSNSSSSSTKLIHLIKCLFWLRPQAVLHSYHSLLSPNETSTQIPNVGEEFVEGGVSMDHVGEANEEVETVDDAEADEEKINGPSHLSDDSMEGGHELTHDLPGSHGDAAGLELAL